MLKLNDKMLVLGSIVRMILVNNRCGGMIFEFNFKLMYRGMVVCVIMVGMMVVLVKCWCY